MKIHQAAAYLHKLLSEQLVGYPIDLQVGGYVPASGG